MPITRRQLVREYVSAIHDGEAALFVGAGLSRASGFVDWKGLLRGCAEEVGLDLDREQDLVAVAQYYLNFRSNNRWRLNQLLLKEFDRPGSLTENHEIIARLPISTIWTTNFDTLLEQALSKAQRKISIKAEDAGIGRPTRRNEVVIYKMHGDIARPQEIVICKSDYERYAQLHPIFQNALEADLVSKTFLFLGFSFSDPHLNYMLGHLHALLEGNQRSHFAIMRRVRENRSLGEDGKRNSNGTTFRPISSTVFPRSRRFCRPSKLAHMHGMCSSPAVPTNMRQILMRIERVISACIWARCSCRIRTS
jgi:hypothetical protein